MGGPVITSISLKRFRGFRRADLELKPLTVLLGPNSAGKSSFLQALAALHFVRRLGLSPATLSPAGASIPAWPSWPLDFGTRETLQFKGTRDDGGVRIQITNEHEGTSTEIAYEFGRDTAESLSLSGVEINEKAGVSRVGDEGVIPASPVQEGAISPVTVLAAHESVVEPIAQPKTSKIVLREVGPGFWQGPDGEAVVVTLNSLQLEYYARRTGTLVGVPSIGQKQLLKALDDVRYLRPNLVDPYRTQPG